MTAYEMLNFIKSFSHAEFLSKFKSCHKFLRQAENGEKSQQMHGLDVPIGTRLQLLHLFLPSF